MSGEAEDGAGQPDAGRRRFIRLALLATAGLLPPRRALARTSDVAGCWPCSPGAGCTAARCADAPAAGNGLSEARGELRQAPAEPVVLPLVDGGVRLRPHDHPSLAGERGVLAIQAGSRSGTLFYLLVLPDGGFAAVSPTCPHEGCIVVPVGWELFCPCHGSTFLRDGGLLIGPSRLPLETFPVRRERGDSLFVELEGPPRTRGGR